MRPLLTLWRLLRLAWPLKGWIALAALLGFLTVGAGIGLMATSAYLISEAALHPSVAALQVSIVGVRFFGISRGIFRYCERYVSHYVALGLLARLRVWFYSAVEPLAPARLTTYRSGDLLARVVSDIGTLQDFYVRVMAPPLVATVTGLAMWFFLGAYDASLALVLVASYLVASIGIPVLMHLLTRGIGARLVAVRADLNAAMVDGIQGIADLIAFGHEKAHAERVQRLNREMIALQRRMAWANGLQGALSNGLMNLAAWTILVTAIPLVRSGQLDGVNLAVVVLATLASFESFLPLPVAAQHLSTSLAAASRLFEIVHAQPAATDKASPTPKPADRSIAFDNVSFRYNPGEPLVLDNVSFNLPQGRCLAIVGPSGAGKSTIANLLLRFWDYSEGRILLGGQELSDYRQDDVRSMISVVAQTTHLFNTTIRENLLVARRDATEEDLIRAAKQAHIYTFIRSLPGGFDTPVGEQGLSLSGGERQRIAIARAFLKNAPILVLDEATANLDALTEQEVLAALRDLAQRRTTVIITHRLVGLEMADEILVMHDGAIVERGPHRDLVQLEGLYWKMLQIQNEVLTLREQAA